MKRVGFTLVDLLVTIFILVVVICLVIPPLQPAREAARQMQCGNNLKQQALAALNHEATSMAYPSGGWNVNYVGDPDRGFGPKQPGTWTFSVLPFLEQNAMYQVGATGTAETCEQKNTSDVLKTPIACFLCPTRRNTETFPAGFALGVTNYQNSNFSGSEGAKSDYAANYGTTVMKIGNWISYETPVEEIQSPEEPTGVIFDASAIALDEIRDGTNNTYLIGEKFVFKGQAAHAGPGDKASMYAGIAGDDSNSNFRSAGVMETKEWFLPTRDALETEADPGAWRGFGGPHSGIFQMVMCSGAEFLISYQIDGQVHAYLANRHDETGTSAQEYLQ